MSTPADMQPQARLDPIPHARRWISLLPPSVVIRVFSPLFTEEIAREIRRGCGRGKDDAGYCTGTVSGEKFKLEWHNLSVSGAYGKRKRFRHTSTTVISGRVRDRYDGSIVTLRIRQSAWGVMYTVGISIIAPCIIVVTHGFHGGFRNAAIVFLVTYFVLMTVSLLMSVRYLLPQVKLILSAPVSLAEAVRSLD